MQPYDQFRLPQTIMQPQPSSSSVLDRKPTGMVSGMAPHLKYVDPRWAQICKGAMHGVIEEFFGDMEPEDIYNLLRSENRYEERIAESVKKNSFLEKSMMNTVSTISKVIKKKRETQEAQRALKNQHRMGFSGRTTPS
jgi:hypothetical protein